MRIGVAAGIDDPLGPALLRTLAGVERVLLAGGIGSARALAVLETVAPVTAIVGHRDFLAFGDRLPETAHLDIAGAHVVVTHLVGSLTDLVAPVRRLLEDNPPDMIVYGHEPRPHVEWLGGTLFFCPGRATPARPGTPGTCGLVDIEGPGRLTAHVLDVR